MKVEWVYILAFMTPWNMAIKQAMSKHDNKAP